MAGMPCIRGLRIPVATVLAMVADGITVDEVVDELPDLVADDAAGGFAVSYFGNGNLVP